MPDWLVAANRVNLGSFGAGSAAVVVEQWTDFTVDATGKFTSDERQAIRVLDRRSAEPYLRATGFENNDSSVVSIQTWAISPSGAVVQSNKKKDLVTEADFAGFELYSDSREKIIDAPGAEDGSLVGMEVVREGRIPINGERFSLEAEIPVRLAHFHATVPSGSLHWFVNHPDRLKVVSQSANAVTLETSNRPGIPPEPNAPPFSSLATQVVVNYDANGATAVNSWAEAARAYLPLFSNAEEPDAKLLAQVDQLTAGDANEISKLSSLYSFVSRQVRYVAIEIGIGGYRPHPASQVFKYMYGDCKDKTTLLLTMLDHIGLRGYPALVGTRDDIEADPNMPTLATFDHMVVALPVPANLRSAVEQFPAYDPKSQILWIDPTSETAPLGQLPEMDQGVFALTSSPHGGELLRIPEAPAGQNGLQYDAHLHLDSAGNGTANVQVKYLGASNARRHAFYRGRSQSEIRRTFEERVARYVSSSAFQRATISGLAKNNDQIVERFSFRGDFADATTGDIWFFQPLFLSGMAVPEVGPRPRTLPLDLGTPFSLNGEYHIELPPGLHFGRLPDKASLHSEFGEFETEFSLDGGILVAKQSLSFVHTRIPPEKYAAFRDFVNAILRAESQRLRVVTASP